MGQETCYYNGKELRRMAHEPGAFDSGHYVVRMSDVLYDVPCIKVQEPYWVDIKERRPKIYGAKKYGPKTMPLLIKLSDGTKSVAIWGKYFDCDMVEGWVVEGKLVERPEITHWCPVIWPEESPKEK